MWIGLRERREKFDGKELSLFATLSKLKLNGATQEQIDQYLSQIDVIWIKDGKPYYAIEVEYSTAVSEAFNRCSNLPTTGQEIQRVIIIPKETERMVQRKLQSTLLKERMEQDQWKFIYLTSLQSSIWRANQAGQLNPTFWHRPRISVMKWVRVTTIHNHP